MKEGLKRHNKRESSELINDLASKGIPFVFLISFSGEDNLVCAPDKAASHGFYLDMPGWVNHSFQTKTDRPLQFSKHPMDREHYHRAFEYVKGEIHYGNSFFGYLWAFF